MPSSSVAADQRPTTNDQRPSPSTDKASAIARPSSVVFRPSSFVLRRLSFLVCLLALLLASCGQAAPAESEAASPGGVNPESVTESFFDDLGAALKDPALRTANAREQWADRLADYFAPNERDDQREALGLALDSFAADMRELTPQEQLLIEIRYDNIRKLSDDGATALVEPVNGRIYLQVMRDDYITHERETPLSDIIGRADGAVPTVKIGNDWYLTETY